MALSYRAPYALLSRRRAPLSKVETADAQYRAALAWRFGYATFALTFLDTWLGPSPRHHRAAIWRPRAGTVLADRLWRTGWQMLRHMPTTHRRPT